MSFKQDILDASKHLGLPPEMIMMLAAAQGDPSGILEIERTKGKKIILPENMSYQECITWCNRKIEEENQSIGIDEVIDAWPFDGAIAFMKAMKTIYGWTSLVPTPGFFGSKPPQMISVPIGPNDTIQVPWGRVKIPNVQGHLDTGIAIKGGRLMFRIGGEVLQKHKQEIHELANEVRRIVDSESIYKGKAITVSFPDDIQDFDPWNYAPEFLDLSMVKREELIFSSPLQNQVEINLFTPVEHTQKCRDNGIPLKRGTLLAGPYGTGKTLTANVLAALCQEHGWSYIYLRDAHQLAEAVDFAKRYQPAVIFAEDIDKVVKERTNWVNKILNVIDGIDSKGSEIMVVLTTNHIEDIQQAMLRPGRLDSVISLSYPDAEASAKLIRLYARDLIDPYTDLEAIGELLSGSTPAVLREVVERSKLSAMRRLQPGEKLEITIKDLEVTAHGIKEHLRLLEPKEVDTRTNAEKLGDSMGKRIVEGMERVALNPTQTIRI